MASKHDGAASYSNIVTIGESPLVPGHRLGRHQRRQRPGQPRRRCNLEERRRRHHQEGRRAEPKPTSRVSSRPPSMPGTCYVSFDAHRTDDHKPYVFVTRDFGQTWTSIAANLPEGNVNVIKEDPKNRNLLYLGTEYAFYISLTGGKDWKTVHDRPALGPHRRHPGAPARQRPRRGHTRPQHLDHRRRHAAPTDDRRRHDG